MGRNLTRRRVSLSLVFTSALAVTSLAVVGEARADARSGRLGFFPGKLTGKNAATDPSQCNAAAYCGGPVISAVQLVSVYWTNQVASATTQWAPGYASTIVNSELLDMLSEYSTTGQTGLACGVQTPDAGVQYFGPPTPFTTGQTITRGTATQGYTITPTQQTGTSIVDDNAAIGLELAGQIAAGNLPKPQYDAQGYPVTLYMVYFPQGYDISLQSMGSCSAFGGYHMSAPYTAAAGCKGQYIPYAVIPDCGGEGSQLSDVVSHELAEAITDTDIGPTTPATADYSDGAWYLGPTDPCIVGSQQCPSNCGEVGDVCENSGDNTIPNSSVISQNIWSNVQATCAVNNPNIGTQTGPNPVMVCTSGSSSGGGSGSSSGSGSGGGSGSGSGGGSGSGSGSGGGSGGGSGSSGGSSSSGSGGSGSSSGSSGGLDASTPMEDAGVGDSGGNGATGGSGSSSGCSCDMSGTTPTGGFAALGALIGLALLGRSRRR